MKSHHHPPARPATPAAASVIATEGATGELPAITTTLLTELRDALRKASVETPGRPPRLLVAYSGGMDSTVLLHLLTLMRDLGEVDVAAAYYHHGWRGTPAPELPRLHKAALQWRVPLFFIPPEANETPTEAMARQVRYSKLSALALQWEADAVLTAHHQDDQIETILFRLLRGTGLEGMEGIRPRLTYNPQFEEPTQPGSSKLLSGRVAVVRPLLNVRREQLKAHCDAHQLSFFEDPGNLQRRYSRNVIRHDIWPVIEKAFPTAGRALLRMAHVTRGDLDLLEEVTEQHWHQMAEPDPGPTNSAAELSEQHAVQQWRLQQIPLSQLTVPHQRRLLRHWLKSLNLAADFADVERLVTFVRQAHSYQVKAPKLSMGVTPDQEKRFALLVDGWLQLRTGAAADSTPKVYAPRPAVTIQWSETEAVRTLLPGSDDQYLHIEPLPYDKLPYKWENQLPSLRGERVWVHLERALLPQLECRFRRSGDRVQPVGFTRDTSLKRYLIHQKVAQAERDCLPLLAWENQILWIPGVTVSEALWVDGWRLPTHCLWVGPMPVLPKPRIGSSVAEEDEDETSGDEDDAKADILSGDELEETEMLSAD